MQRRDVDIDLVLGDFVAVVLEDVDEWDDDFAAVVPQIGDFTFEEQGAAIAERVVDRVRKPRNTAEEALDRTAACTAAWPFTGGTDPKRNTASSVR